MGYQSAFQVTKTYKWKGITLSLENIFWEKPERWERLQLITLTFFWLHIIYIFGMFFYELMFLFLSLLSFDVPYANVFLLSSGCIRLFSLLLKAIFLV